MEKAKQQIQNAEWVDNGVVVTFAAGTDGTAAVDVFYSAALLHGIISQAEVLLEANGNDDEDDAGK